MKVCHAETQLCIDSKSSTASKHDDGRRLVWIVSRECDFAMIYTILVLSTFGSLKSVVPLREIVWSRMCSYVGRWILHEHT